MTLPVAGWYPDPDNSARFRWWNGIAWTDNFTDAAAPAAVTASNLASPLPPSTPYSYASTPLSAPAGTSWNTVWIWLIVFVPYVSLVGFFLVDWRGMFDLSTITSETAMMMAMFSPGYFLSIALGFAAYGLSVWFAYLDWRELEQRNVPRPFHWAFAFLSSAVYPIGRSVVVKRRTGHGLSPMWVSIALIVLSFVFSIYFSVYLITMVFEQAAATMGY